MFQAIPSRSTLIYRWIWIVIHWNWIFETTFCFLFSTLHSQIEVLWSIGLLRWSLRVLSSTTYWNRKINFLFWSFKKFENIIDNFFVMKHWFYGSLGLNTLNRKQNSFQFHFRICLHLLFDKKKSELHTCGRFLLTLYTSSSSFFPICDWNTVCKFENAYTHVLTQTDRCKRLKLTRFECIFYEKKQGRRLQNCWFSRACLSPHSLNRFNRSSHFEWTQFYINFLFFIDHNSIKFLKRFSISANPIAYIFFICTFGWYSMWLQNGRLKQFQWHYWQFQRICFFLLFLYSRRKCLFSGLNTNCSWNVRYGVQRTEALDLNRNSRLELELKFIFHSAV